MEVEWLILADSAQVVGSKLYLLGGGWDRLIINAEFPVQHPMALALSFRVPWNETNRKHSFQVAILDSDGTQKGQFGGQLEVGRPPGIPAGQDQRIQAVVNMSLKIEAPQTFEVMARIEGQDKARTHFNIVKG